MKKALREYQRMVERMGCTIDSIEQNKHYKVNLRHKSGTVVVQTVAATPSDSAWINQSRRELARKLNENHQ